MLPTTKRITQEYGANFIINGKWAYGIGGHNGMDFGVYYEMWGSPALTLTILSTGWDNSGFGQLVRARDQYGYTHWFAHNSTFLVKPGDILHIGQGHSISGNTGFSTDPHGHWGVQLPGFTGYNGFINPRNWPGFSKDQPGGDDMALAASNHTNKVEAIRGFIFRITGNIHSDTDITNNHLGSNATFTAAEQTALANKFFDPNPGSEYMNAGIQAYIDEYGQGEYAGEVAKKARAKVGIPQLRIELMQNPSPSGEYEPVTETLYKKK